MQILIGFVIALCVGLTGVGGGSFTAPALVLIAGLTGAEAVGTALVYSLFVRIAAAPFYVAGKHIHFRYLWFMLLGAMPGLLAGTYFLEVLNTKRWNHIILVMIGVTLICSSALTFIYRKAVRLKQSKSGCHGSPSLSALKPDSLRRVQELSAPSCCLIILICLQAR